jgi:hypothetical protein
MASMTHIDFITPTTLTDGVLEIWMTSNYGVRH